MFIGVYSFQILSAYNNIMGEKKNKNVCIVVLGDIGRSPRMQYHAQSLINEGFDVDIVGYLESPVLTNVQDKSNIISLKKPPPFDKRNYFLS